MAKQLKTKIIHLGKKHGWYFYDHQKNLCMLSFTKVKDSLNMRINVYYSKMIVATCINHPKIGKSQLFRKKVSIKLLEKIFINPRVHTGIGYYKR